MNELSITFTPTLRDYHIAVYYAAVHRYRTGFRLLVVSGLTAAACAFSAYLGLMPHTRFMGYIFIAFLVWAILILAQLESGILKYAKDPNAVIGKEMNITFTFDKMKISTPYNKQSSAVSLDSLFCGFEISSMFLIYLDAAQSVMLPHHCLTAEQRSRVRSILQNCLHDRFYTKNGYSSFLPKRSPLRR